MTQPNPYVEKIEGAYRVAGSRVSLDSIVYAFLEGQTAVSIAQAFPTLALEQVYGAINYYLAHSSEIDAYLAEGEAHYEEMRQKHRRADPMFYQELTDTPRSSSLTKAVQLSFLILIWLSGTTPAVAHGGGLDAYGCHTNRRTGEYHCHRQKDRVPKIQRRTPTENNSSSSESTLPTSLEAASSPLETDSEHEQNIATLIAQADSPEDAETKLEALQAEKRRLEERIAEIEIELEQWWAAKRLLDLREAPESGATVTTSFKADVLETPALDSRVLQELPMGTEVIALGYKEPFWLIRTETTEGYVHEVWIEASPEIRWHFLSGQSK